MGDALLPAKASCQATWTRLFSAAHEHDTWGQLEEAKESYGRLNDQVQEDMGTLVTSKEEHAAVNQLLSLLAARLQALTSGSLDGITASAMAPLGDLIKRLFGAGGPPMLPASLQAHAGTPVAPKSGRGGAAKSASPDAGLSGLSPEPGGFLESLDAAAGATAASGGGTLLPALPPGKGTTISITIEKIGLKDAERYIDPFIDVTMVDAVGRPMGPRQSTPGSTQPRQPQHVLFNHTVHLQTTLQELGPNSAIIFEFIHFKPKGAKNSIRCWCFIDKEELLSGFTPGHVASHILELYKKPTIPERKKKLKLFTAKQLYLHCQVEMH